MSRLDNDAASIAIVSAAAHRRGRGMDTGPYLLGHQAATSSSRCSSGRPAPAGRPAATIPHSFQRPT